MKKLLYKPGDIVSYTPSYNVVELGLSNQIFRGQSGLITSARYDRFGWPRYSIQFDSGSMDFVSNDDINTRNVVDFGSLHGW